MGDPLRLLVVGGYGVAGKAVARAVASRLPGPLRLTLAGRDGGTANAAIAALSPDMPDDADLRALELEATSWAALRAALASCDIVIWCAPLDEATARILVAALIETGTDCVDIAPNHSKHAVLRDAARGLGDAGCGYVIDAGADPGLPGWLAHHVASRHGAPDHVEIVARYCDRDIGRAGIRDVLESIKAGPMVFDQGWHVSRRLPEWRRLPGGLGPAPTLPVFLEELRDLPAHHAMSHLSLRHAGMTLATDIVVLARPILSYGMTRDLFAWAARRFTPVPSALAIRAEAKGQGRAVVADLWRTNLYEATAEAAVLGLEALLERSCAGVGFLWQWDGWGTFATRLAERNFSLRVCEV
jgi:hypothetical protein